MSRRGLLTGIAGVVGLLVAALLAVQQRLPQQRSPFPNIPLPDIFGRQETTCSIDC